MLDHRSGIVPIIRGGVPTYSRTVPRRRQSAPAARYMATALLGGWELPALIEDAGLVLDELVANAADHARGTSVRVTISRTAPCRVRLAVTDLDRRHPPRLRAAAPDDEHGRGLRLVDALADRWGHDVLPWGKRVWAEVAMKP